MHKKRKKPWAVFVAIALAIVLGSNLAQDTELWGVRLYSVFDVLGTIFLHALTLVVVPLVSSSIISGVARMGSDDSFRRLGAKTFAFYLGTSLLAILIGLFFVNLIQPGATQIVKPTTEAEATALSNLKTSLASQDHRPLVNVLMQIVPSNILHAFSYGNMLGLIFFCLLFGYAISRIESSASHVLQKFFEGIFHSMIRITHVIMRFLPYGVFCLVAKVFMVTGIRSLGSVALFALTVLLGLCTFMFLALPLLLRLIGRVSPVRHLKAMVPAIVTAFSTSSSSATLPITIECVEKRAGVSNRVCSLVVPLGNSINMSGSALYECVAAMFVAQAYGIDISWGMQFLVVLMALVTSIGVAGIPSGSLVAILIVLQVIGLPPDGIALFIAVDRLLDMCRTTVNVFSDSCCAVLVAKTEGETDVLSKDPAEMEEVS